MALVAFVRGINVGGHRSFRPSLLAEKLKEYDVVNVGATGTLVIRKPISPARLRAELLRRLPFAARVMICRGHELIRLASGDPFAGQPSRPDVIRFVSVLEKRPRVLPSIPMSLPPDGQWILRILGTQNRFLFGLYRREMKAIGYLGSIDKIFGVSATTRNWNTITTIINVLKSRELKT
ncbi:MAG: DUF1697 domain-containing protein [Candidatus Acidiferrales bacterium]|jgi:uncharacterized protein (DUF1697 family)